MLKKYYNKNIEIIYINNFKYCYYSIFKSVIIDYKKQVPITKININIQYSVCYIFFTKIREFNKNMTTINIEIYIVYSLNSKKTIL